MAGDAITSLKVPYPSAQGWVRLLLCLMIVVLLVLPGSADAASNPRYASFVLDVKRNLVLHESNADAKRYPASLTKLMTLYLTFEALESGKLHWNDRLSVSKRAAGQPQTNISLRTGDKVSVKTLVDSLIIRSANDSAVVLAEAIGKTEWNFAVMMTRKAHKLGMKNTQFRNANGLHNKQQYTTARDISKLAIALRRDFPQHYHLFDKVKFTYNGRTYYTHNKVSRYYDGADGLKTGYVNASGFNLATSVRKFGEDIVAVVLGGRTSKSRDNHMIALLDRALRKVKGTNNFLYAFKDNPPEPQAKPTAPSREVNVAVVPEKKPEIIQEVADAGDDAVPVPQEKPQIRRVSYIPAPKPQHHPEKTVVASASPKADFVSEAAEDVQEWGIQVGTFFKKQEALLAAANAMSLAAGPLSSSIVAISDADSQDDSGDGIHRARLSNLTHEQAQNACRMLQSSQGPCFVYRVSE